MGVNHTALDRHPQQQQQSVKTSDCCNNRVVHALDVIWELQTQSYFFIAASNASGSKSNEISRLESGSVPALFPSSCRCWARLNSCEEVVAEGNRDAGAGVGRARGGRNGFLIPAECDVLDDDERDDTLRVMPSARLDACTCCDCGSADVIKVEAERVDVDVDADVRCRGSDCNSCVVIGAGDPSPLDDTPSIAAAGGGRVGAGTGCCECEPVEEVGRRAEGCGCGGPCVGLDRVDVWFAADLCAGGAGAGRSSIGAERTGVGEDGSVCFLGCRVLVVMA